MQPMRILAVILLLSFAVANTLVADPLLSIIVTAAGPLLVVSFAYPKPLEKLFIRLLAILLIGYAILGRSFAGLGVPPVYLGEIVLAVGVLAAVANRWALQLPRTPWAFVLLGFMAWGAVRTVPYIGMYGLDALRDAVIWGYGVFGLLVARLILRHDLVARIPAAYRRLLPWIVFAAPAWVIASVVLDLGGGPEAAVAGAKAGDVSVHLGGAAAFLLVGASRPSISPPGRRRWSGEWLLWTAILVGIIAMGSLNRGGLVSAIAAILVATCLVPVKAGRKLVLAATAGICVITLWLSSGVSFHIREDRPITPEQIAENLKSIGGGGSGTLEGTREWRIAWWTAIINYTVHGPYFWTGKGFGLNVAYDDGIEPYPDSPTRSPHNGHLTILARAGVPGLGLWVLLQLGFGLALILAFLEALRARDRTRAALLAWVLAYTVAALANASFDVYLEGPQGGIWFWCVWGYGIALLVSPQSPLARAGARRQRVSADPRLVYAGPRVTTR